MEPEEAAGSPGRMVAAFPALPAGVFWCTERLPDPKPDI